MLKHVRVTGLHVLDQDVALDFYVNKLGLEVRTDVDLGFMRWLTVGVPGDADREIMLEKPGAPNHDDATTAVARDQVTKGAAAGWLIFATDDVQGAYDDLKAKGVELPEAPEEREYGTDFGFRDPFGNPIRIGRTN